LGTIMCKAEHTNLGERNQKQQYRPGHKHTLRVLSLISSEIYSCAFALKSNISNLQEFSVWCSCHAPQTFNSLHATNKIY
jgi:hypothetical protein